MEHRAKETAKAMVAEEMKKMMEQMTNLKEERDLDKQTISGLMDKFERIQQEERSREEVRMKEAEAKRV